TASEILSAILSGCPSVTLSLVNTKSLFFPIIIFSFKIPFYIIILITYDYIPFFFLALLPFYKKHFHLKNIRTLTYTTLYTLMYLIYAFLLKIPLFLSLYFVIPFLLYLWILYSVFYSIKLPHIYQLWTVLVLN